jgi:hypothetical protein
MISKHLQRPSDMEPEEWHAMLERLVDDVRSATPVKTGKLRDGWRADVTDDDAEVSNDVDYAEHVDEGTKHMSGRHMSDKLDEGRWAKVRKSLS